MSIVAKDKAKQPIFYVYALLDNRKPGDYRYSRYRFKHEPFYIGKGHGKRCHVHADLAVNKNLKGHLYNLIRKIIRETDEFPLIVIKKTGLTEKEAFDLEKTLIKLIGRHNRKTGPLTNLTDGGDGAVGNILTEAQKKLHADATRDWYKYMTVAEYNKFIEALSEGVKQVHASMSEDAKKVRAKQIANGLKKMSPEAKAKRMEAISNGNKIHYYSLSEEEKKVLAKKKSDGYAKIPQEVRDANNASRSKASKAMHANRSEEETKRLKEIWSEKRKQFWASKTPEEIKAISDKQIASRNYNRQNKMRVQNG